MALLKKYVWVLFGIGIFALYFFTRLYNILALPIFTDEAIYVRWAQIASTDAAWRFISLTDGKQPMYVWIAMVLMKLISDPLFAGRVVSVLAGVGSVIGIFFLTSEVFKNPSASSGKVRFGAWKLGLFASFIYVVYPFTLVYDRMALYDSLVTMFMIWALYFEILLVRYVRLDLAMILGIIIGGGLLTKTHVNFAFVLLPFSLLLFNWKTKDWRKQLWKWILFAVVAVVIANAMYLILRLSPFFHVIAEKNYVFAYRPEELIKAPFAYFLYNIGPLIDWVVKYMTLPFLTLVVASFLVSKKFMKEKILLLLWFVLPILATAFIGRVLYPRFILFMTIPLLILGTYTLYMAMGFVKKLWLKIVVVIVFLTMFVINDYFVITDFAKAGIPKSDKGQFLAAWPSGVGVPETIAFLKEKSKNQKIYVGTEGTFGLMPYALEMYFVNNPNVTIKAFWPVTDLPGEDLVEASKKMPTYVVFYQPCVPCAGIGVAPERWNLTEIFQIKKLEVDTYYTLYELKAK